MWQRLLELINQVKRRIRSRLQSIALRKLTTLLPESATKAEAPPVSPTIAEPELGLAAGVPPQYRQRESLFTYRERVFFKALLEDVGDQYQVFAKVRLGDILWLFNEPENRKFHNNQLQCKHFDFVVCDKDSYKPLLAIELDDSSHDKYDHHARDEFKERVCKETRLKLLREQVQKTYPKGYVGERVHSAIHEKADK